MTTDDDTDCCGDTLREVQKSKMSPPIITCECGKEWTRSTGEDDDFQEIEGFPLYKSEDDTNTLHLFGFMQEIDTRTRWERFKDWLGEKVSYDGRGAKLQ